MSRKALKLSCTQPHQAHDMVRLCIATWSQHARAVRSRAGQHAPLYDTRQSKDMTRIKQLQETASSFLHWLSKSCIWAWLDGLLNKRCCIWQARLWSAHGWHVEDSVLDDLQPRTAMVGNATRQGISANPQPSAAVQDVTQTTNIARKTRMPVL